jgi:hypothetical protein
MLKPNVLLLLNTLGEKCLYVTKETILAPEFSAERQENHDKSIIIGLTLLSETYSTRKTNVPEITKFWDVPLRSFD